MTRCEHEIPAGTHTWTGTVVPPPYTCVFCHVKRLEQDVKEYSDQVATLTERVRNMTSAATSAAASTVKAIERIQEMEPVVKAATTWHAASKMLEHAKDGLVAEVAARRWRTAVDALSETVDAWIAARSKDV